MTDFDAIRTNLSLWHAHGNWRELYAALSKLTDALEELSKRPTTGDD